MDRLQFFIPGPLPGLNEMMDAAKRKVPWLSRRRKYQVTQWTLMKDDWTRRVAACVGHQKNPVFERCRVYCLWVEPNSRRDPDNVFAARKFILDGLVHAGVIHDDSRKYVKGLSDEFGPNDKKMPGVWVTVEAA